jgi:hypothetical protein
MLSPPIGPSRRTDFRSRGFLREDSALGRFRWSVEIVVPERLPLSQIQLQRINYRFFFQFVVLCVL